jgi:CheY-like chemotaxis protein
MSMKTVTYNPSFEKPPVCILVVDDHPNSAVTMARVISQLGPGVEVLSAESAEQALNLMRDKAVDLLITDLVMPGETGLGLIEKIQVWPNSRPAYTILMTAYNVPGLKAIARRLMVNEVVSKPIQPEDMNRIITRAIEVCGYGPIARANPSPGQGVQPVSSGDPDPENPIQ